MIAEAPRFIGVNDVASLQFWSERLRHEGVVQLRRPSALMVIPAIRLHVRAGTFVRATAFGQPRSLFLRQLEAVHKAPRFQPIECDGCAIRFSLRLSFVCDLRGDVEVAGDEDWPFTCRIEDRCEI